MKRFVTCSFKREKVVMKMSVLSLESQRILDEVASDLASGLAKCLVGGGYLNENVFFVIGKVLKSISVYMIYPRGTTGQIYCRLIGGYPVQNHGIGLDDNIQKHPDIKFVCESESCEILIIDSGDASKTDHIREVIRNKGIKFIILAPIRMEKKVVGVIAVDICNRDTLDEWLQNFIKMLGRSTSRILKEKYSEVCLGEQKTFPRLGFAI